jgi:anti-sigma B factor antagonist
MKLSAWRRMQAAVAASRRKRRGQQVKTNPFIAKVMSLMKLEYNELENGIRLIKLIGRLDMEGTNSVGIQFAEHCAGERVFVLVDLSQVHYLSSIGIPLLITSAKAVASHGGRLAFLTPQSNVKYILDITGVSNVIRIYKDLETAKERLMLA